MKNALLILFALVALTSNAQNLNGDGVPIASNIISSVPVRTSPLPISESYSVVYFDSIRILTEINDTSNADAYPWISPDGLHLYFTRGSGSNHIVYSERPSTNDPFSLPVTLTNPIGVPSSIWLSDDELDAYICSGTSIYYCHRTATNLGFTTYTLLTMNGLSATFVGNVSLDSTQNEMYVYSVLGNSSISIYTRSSASSFDFVRNLTFPPGVAPTPGQLSKDNLTYYSSGRDNGSKNRLYEFTRASTADTFDVSTFQLIPGTEDTTYQHSQPTANEDGTILFYAGALANTWGANELFMATGSLVNSISSVENQLQVSIWPNPTTGILKVSTENKSALQVKVFNSLGQCVFSNNNLFSTGTAVVDLSSLSNGVYTCVCSSGGRSSFTKILLTK